MYLRWVKTRARALEDARLALQYLLFFVPLFQLLVFLYTFRRTLQLISLVPKDQSLVFFSLVFNIVLRTVQAAPPSGTTPRRGNGLNRIAQLLTG